MGPPAAAGGGRGFFLGNLLGATERSAPLRENVLRSHVKDTGSQRTLAVHEAEQEVLAGADRDNPGFVWCVAGIGQRLGDCALHLHTLLGWVSFSIGVSTGSGSDRVSAEQCRLCELTGPGRYRSRY